MTLKTALRNLKAELEDRTNCGSEKAFRLNYIGMDIFVDVFAELPDNDYVRLEVVPLLTRAMNVIRTGSRTGMYVKDMDHWVYVMNRRIDGLRKYCAKKRVA
jgi:hypothetical protein